MGFFYVRAQDLFLAFHLGYGFGGIEVIDAAEKYGSGVGRRLFLLSDCAHVAVVCVVNEFTFFGF